MTPWHSCFCPLLHRTSSTALNNGTRNVRAESTGKEEDGAGGLFDPTWTSQWDIRERHHARSRLLLLTSTGDAQRDLSTVNDNGSASLLGARKSRLDHAKGDAIGPHAVSSELLGHRLGHAYYG